MVQNNKNRISFLRKIKYSIRNFEKYPEMSELGVGSSIKYVSLLILIMSILISLATIYLFMNTINNFRRYFENDQIYVSYENGEFDINVKENFIADTPIGLVAFNINNEANDFDENNKIEIEFLRDTVKINGFEYSYIDLLQKYKVPYFSNEDIVKFISSSKIYLIMFFTVTIELFVLYLISTMLDILVLSLFGLITCLISKIKIKYSYLFSMSIYALTISIILKCIYKIVNILTDFEIKYFDIMYTGVSYICLAAAIFMIKSDIIRQYIEMVRISELKKKEMEEEENKKEENDKDKKDKKKEKKDKNENNDEEESPDINSEGSNA